MLIARKSPVGQVLSAQNRATNKKPSRERGL